MATNIPKPTINRIFLMNTFDLLRTKVTMGNMYMCLDTQLLWYDSGTTETDRAIYQYISVETINDLRYNVVPSYGKSYYCWEDNSLWLWINKWIEVYSESTYPSAYIYNDIPEIQRKEALNPVYLNDMPNLPADDNGLLKDGSVIVRDRNRIIKGKLYINDNNDNMVISSYLGGGMRFLPNGKMGTMGELYLDDHGKSLLRSSLNLMDSEAYVDYSEHPEKDTSEFPKADHIYKLYHEGNLDVSAIRILTPIEIYNKLLEKDELPEVFDFDVLHLNGYSSEDFARKSHIHSSEDIYDLYAYVHEQADISMQSVFNNMEGIGISGKYDKTKGLLTLKAQDFTLALTGGVTGSVKVKGLQDSSINVVVDPTKHIHENYITRMDNLQTQIDDIGYSIDQTYTKDVIDNKIDEVRGTTIPTEGKPLLVNDKLELDINVTSAKQLDHTIQMNLTGDITGTTSFDLSDSTIDIETTIDVTSGAFEEKVDNIVAKRSFKFEIGDGSPIAIISHDLNSYDIMVQFRDKETKKQVYLDTVLLDENTIKVISEHNMAESSINMYIYKMV